MFTNDTQTLGHVHSSSLMLRLASHHLAAFLRLIVGTKTPLACRVAPAPAAAPAHSSHTASRNARRCCSSTCEPRPPRGGPPERKYKGHFFRRRQIHSKMGIMKLRKRNDIIMLSLPNLALVEAGSLPLFSRSGVQFFFPLSCFLPASSFL